jgi:hypothetical protein
MSSRFFPLAGLASSLVVFVVVGCGEAPPPKDRTANDVTPPTPGASAVAPVSKDAGVASAPPPPAFACEGTSLRSGAKEYCLVTARRSFEQAGAECERMHGRLAVLSDAEEAKKVTAQLVSPWGYGSGLWLGCSDEEAEGKWKCNGKPLVYKNWAEGKPDNTTALEDCQQWMSDSGQWNDASCSLRTGYVCRGDEKLKCTGRKVTFGKSTFCAHGEELLDWDSANKACARSGGKLAVLTSAEESHALDSLKLPLPIPSNEPGEGVWIGLSDLKEEGKYRWSSDAPLVGGNWLPKQPDDANGGEDCASMTLGDGKWNDVDCIRALPFLCEAP